MHAAEGPSYAHAWPSCVAGGHRSPELSIKLSDGLGLHAPTKERVDGFCTHGYLHHFALPLQFVHGAVCAWCMGGVYPRGVNPTCSWRLLETCITRTFIPHLCRHHVQRPGLTCCASSLAVVHWPWLDSFRAASIILVCEDGKVWAAGYSHGYESG
jgi:hypothetical protein